MIDYVALGVVNKFVGHRDSRLFPTSTMNSLAALLSLIFVSAMLFRPCDSVFVYTWAEKGKKRCFVETIPLGGKLVGKIAVEEGVAGKIAKATINKSPTAEKADVAVIVRRMATNTIEHTFPYEPEEAGEQFEFTFKGSHQSEEDFELCLTVMSDQKTKERKTIRWKFSFTFYALDQGVASPHSEVAQEEHVDDIAVRIMGLSQTMKGIKTRLTQYRSLEQEIRDVSESNNMRVAWFSVAQTILLACAGVWQIYHLKSFFKAKKLV